MSVFEAPNISSTSFNCPRCGALAQQFWYEVVGIKMDKDDHPQWYRDDIEDWINGPEAPEGWSAETKAKFVETAKRINSEDVFLHGTVEPYKVPQVRNLHLSECYGCNNVSVWIGQSLAYPNTTTEFQPVENMPASVQRDFVEAAKVYSVSARAAAALLRVCIETLCNEINGKKKPIFDGIGELVRRGLDDKIQKALDIVRVTGNEAVHPGQIDFEDTPETAQRLFKLVNIIVEKLITLPKEIDEVYESLPEDKRKAIERRDKKNESS